MPETQDVESKIALGEWNKVGEIIWNSAVEIKKIIPDKSFKEIVQELKEGLDDFFRYS